MVRQQGEDGSLEGQSKDKTSRESLCRIQPRSCSFCLAFFTYSNIAVQSTEARPLSRKSSEAHMAYDLMWKQSISQNLPLAGFSPPPNTFQPRQLYILFLLWMVANRRPYPRESIPHS
ncbi:hypothetical protein ACFX2K_023500 [Malus domestica]